MNKKGLKELRDAYEKRMLQDGNTNLIVLPNSIVTLIDLILGSESTT